MSCQAMEQGAVLSAPYVDRAIVTPARQLRAVGTPCHRTDRSLEERVVPAMTERRHIEHFCPKPIRTRGQPLTIRTPRQPEEAVAAIFGRLEYLETDTGCRIP